MTAAGVSGEILAAGRGSDVAASFLGTNCRLTATDAETVNVSTPATSRASGPVCPSCRTAARQGTVLLKVPGIVGEREVDVLRGRQRRAPREGELGFCGREDRHGQRVFEDRHELVVAARTDHDQGLGLPVGAGEHGAQPPNQVFLGHDPAVERGLHRAVAEMHDQRDNSLGLEHAHRGGAVADDLRDPPSQRLGGLRQPHGHDVVETGVGQGLQQQRGLGVGVVAPGDTDGMQTVTARRGDRFTAQHRSGRLFGGPRGAGPAPEADLKCVAVHGGAVGVLPFDEDEADGGRRYR